MNSTNSNFTLSTQERENLLQCDLSGKVAIIYNATLNVANRAAIHLASHGCQVILVDSKQNESRLENLAKRCDNVAKYGNKWQCIQGKWQRLQRATIFTVSSTYEIATLVSSTIATFNRIDLILFKSSNPSYESIVSRALLPTLEKTLSEDLLKFTKLIQCALPALEATFGAIVNLSTTYGVGKPHADSLAFSMTQSSIEMLVRCLALEVGPKKVRINSINHLVIEEESSMIKGLEVNQSMIDQFAATLTHQLSADDVALAVLFLANSKSQYLNGINLIVDNAKNLE